MLMQQVIENLRELAASVPPEERGQLRAEIEKWIAIRTTDLANAVSNRDGAVTPKYKSLWSRWVESIQRQIQELKQLLDSLDR